MSKLTCSWHSVKPSGRSAAPQGCRSGRATTERHTSSPRENTFKMLIARPSERSSVLSSSSTATFRGGRHDHQDLIARAARRVEGLRPPLISAETAGELTQLLKFRHAFRHSYGTFQFAKAAPNLPLAARAIPRLRDELTTFARTTGFLPGA